MIIQQELLITESSLPAPPQWAFIQPQSCCHCKAQVKSFETTKLLLYVDWAEIPKWTSINPLCMTQTEIAYTNVHFFSVTGSKHVIILIAGLISCNMNLEKSIWKEKKNQKPRFECHFPTPGPGDSESTSQPSGFSLPASIKGRWMPVSRGYSGR